MNRTIRYGNQQMTSSHLPSTSSWTVILVENVTVEDLKGGMIGIVDDTGNSGTKFFHLFRNFQVPVSAEFI